ncbi:MAG: hypothetical protein ACP5C3_09990 [Methanomicrobiales archaeon]
MELLWFYVAVVLAISDEVHTFLFWNVFADFYILLGGIIKETVASNIKLWLVHEILESIFHFVVLSVVFFSLEIGVLGALIHMVIDLYHELSGIKWTHLQHRALHFTIESIFFMLMLSGR